MTQPSLYNTSHSHVSSSTTTNSQTPSNANEPSTSCFASILHTFTNKTSAHHPQQQQPVGDAMDLLNREMNHMTIQEREKAYEDVHGVAEIITESPELVDDSLLEFEQYIMNAPSKQKESFRLAQEQNAAFAWDRKRLLCFLRCDNFAVRKAADRFLRYWDEKLSLFGKDLLAQTITLDRLEPLATKTVESGCIQVLPRRDSSGRAILFNAQRFHNFERQLIPMLQNFWYMVESVMEDEETQKKGLVYIVYNVGPVEFTEIETKLFFRAPTVANAVPLKIAAIHYCFNDARIRHALNIIMLGVGPQLRARFRICDGSDTECMYALLSFGIPTSILPLDSEGGVKTKEHAKWIKKRRFKEMNFGFEGVDVPGKNDVLLGRGKPFQVHPGNIRFLQIIEELVDKYAQANRGAKMDVAREVVDRVNARFLFKDPQSGWFVEAKKDLAIEKVCYAFRNFRLRQPKSGTQSPHRTPPASPLYSSSVDGASVDESSKDDGSTEAPGGKRLRLDVS